MNTHEQIYRHIDSFPEPKRSDILTLHELMLRILPNGKLWFNDGKNEDGKIIANPTIGYGFLTLKYANGKTRNFFKISLLSNTAGISIHILGLDDKHYLTQTYGKKIGKAKVTGYCIRFKKLQDVHIDILESALRYGFEVSLNE
jgi:hypothetical protein